MTDQPENPVQPIPPSGPNPEDSRCVVILDRDTSTPKAIDFYRLTPFQMMAIGEWLLLKAKQMITAAESMETQKRNGIEVPTLDKPDLGSILRAHR